MATKNVVSTSTTSNLANNVVLTPGQKAAATRKANLRTAEYARRAAKAAATRAANRLAATTNSGSVTA